MIFDLQIRSAVENSTSDYDKDKLQERLAKLSGGVAVLKVHKLILSWPSLLMLFYKLLSIPRFFCAKIDI